jgi:hypothetical protein
MPDSTDQAVNASDQLGPHTKTSRSKASMTAGVAGGRPVAGAKRASATRFKSDHIKDNALAKRMDSGRIFMSNLLRSWISLNGWTYDDVVSIVEVLSSGLPLLHSSQISNLINGKLEPKSRFFVGLDYLNKACACSSDERSNLPIPIARKLIGVRPVRSETSEDSKLWTAGDFLNLFCGLEARPFQWIDLHNRSQQSIYDDLQSLNRLIHSLCIAKRADFLPSTRTIAGKVPRKSFNEAISALGGITSLSAKQFEEFIPLYAVGMSDWLGAVVTPFTLYTAIQQPKRTTLSPEDALRLFVTPETTLDGALVPKLVELDLDEPNQEFSAVMEGYEAAEIPANLNPATSH